VLGALNREDTARVGEHLRGCVSCTDVYDLIRDVPTFLSRQSPEDVAELLATTGGNEANRKHHSHRHAIPTTAAQAARPTRSRQARSQLVRSGPARSRTLLAAAAVLIVGVGLGLAQLRPEPEPTGQPFVVTNASETAAGVRATVTVSVSPSGSTVELAVQGLKAGIRYTLRVVTRDGRTLPAIDWVATGVGQTVHGDVSAAVGDLTFFALSGPDGVVLTVPFAAVATRT
jgi:hypothetical protein